MEWNGRNEIRNTKWKGTKKLKRKLRKGKTKAKEKEGTAESDKKGIMERQ